MALFPCPPQHGPPLSISDCPQHLWRDAMVLALWCGVARVCMEQHMHVWDSPWMWSSLGDEQMWEISGREMMSHPNSLPSDHHPALNNYS